MAQKHPNKVTNAWLALRQWVEWRLTGNPVMCAHWRGHEKTEMRRNKRNLRRRLRRRPCQCDNCQRERLRVLKERPPKDVEAARLQTFRKLRDQPLKDDT